MHRQRTKLSHRVNRVFTHRADRVAKAIERQGIRATYELHDRLLSNRASRGRFGEAPPQLDDVQRSILSDVRRARLLRPAVPRLFPDEESLARRSRSNATGSSPRPRLTSPRAASTCASGRARSSSCGFRATASSSAPTTPGSGVASSHRLLDIANAYLEMWSKLEYVDVWYSVPQPAAAERISSQRWHRDYNDKHLLKVFLYLVDVDESMGPFQYVAGSQPGGPYADAWGWQPLGQNYPTEEELEARVPASAVQTFTGPAGTLVFCNTAGFHRGGFSTTNPRVLATATYSSPASLASLTVRSYTYTGALDELDAPTRFALT